MYKRVDHQYSSQCCFMFEYPGHNGPSPRWLIKVEINKITIASRGVSRRKRWTYKRKIFAWRLLEKLNKFSFDISISRQGNLTLRFLIMLHQVPYYQKSTQQQKRIHWYWRCVKQRAIVFFSPLKMNKTLRKLSLTEEWSTRTSLKLNGFRTSAAKRIKCEWP